MENTIAKNKVVGIFKYKTDVEAALRELNINGYDKEHISIIGKNNDSIADHEVIISETISNSPIGKPDLSTINVGSANASPDDIARGTNANDSFDEVRNNETKVDPADISKSAVTGGIYGIVGALAILMIPGIGPVFAAGPILAALTSVAGGAVIGSLLGFLKDHNIPDSRADLYTSNFNKGEIIVMIDTDEKFMHAAKIILAKYNPTVVDTF